VTIVLFKNISKYLYFVIVYTCININFRVKYVFDSLVFMQKLKLVSLRNFINVRILVILN